MKTDYEQFFIGGSWVPPSSSERITIRGASTEEVVGGVPEGKPADMDAAVGAARAAFDDPSGWSSGEPGARAEVMDRLADALEARGGEIARRVSMQSGMTLALSSQLEGQMPAVLLRYYAKLLRSTPMEEAREGMFGAPIVVRREPVGVVGAIVPWNAPQGSPPSSTPPRWPPLSRRFQGGRGAGRARPVVVAGVVAVGVSEAYPVDCALDGTKNTTNDRSSHRASGLGHHRRSVSGGSCHRAGEVHDAPQRPA